MLQHTEVLRRSDRRRSERLKVMPCAYLTDEVSALGADVLAMAAIQSQLYQQLRQINANLDQLRTNQNA